MGFKNVLTTAEKMYILYLSKKYTYNRKYTEGGG